MLDIAYNLDGLDDRQVLQKVKGAHDAVAAKPLVFVTPLPTLLDVIGAHDAAEVNLNLIDSLEAQLTAARLNRLVLMEAARARHHALGTYVLGVAAGNPAVVTDGGYEIVQPRSPIQPMGKVAGNMVTSGENDGTAKGKWDRMPGAKSYEVETASHPGGPWTHHSTVTVTHVDFTGLTSGQKVWTRVRAINKLGPGAWSDPACCTVP